MTSAPASQRPPLFTSSLRTFEQEFDYLFRTLRRHGVTEADAEDLVQDVFLVMCRRWSDYQPDRPLRPWLAGIAMHVARSHLRRARREVADGTSPEDPHRPDAPDLIATAHARLLVLRALARLPDRHRTALILHDLEALRMGEIASTLKIPVPTAYTRVRRARLAFAEAVAAIQAGATTPLPADALVALERVPPRAPQMVRERALRRARALHLFPRPPAPEASAAPGWLTLAAGLAVLATALVTAAALQRRARPAFVASSSAAARARAPGRPATSTLASGLLGYWPFDEHGGTRAVDHGGAHRDCLVLGGEPRRAWTEGRRGGALAADGSVWLSCSDPALGGDRQRPVTAAAWIRRDGPQPYHGALLAQQLEGRRDQGILFAVVGDELVLNSPVWSEEVLSAALPAPRTNWVHVAFTHGSDGTRLYVGGVEVARAAPGRVASGGSPMRAPLMVGATRWGTRVDQPRQLFHGAIDELALYDRALTGAEVAALAGGARPVE